MNKFCICEGGEMINLEQVSAVIGYDAYGERTNSSPVKVEVYLVGGIVVSLSQSSAKMFYTAFADFCRGC